MKRDATDFLDVRIRVLATLFINILVCTASPLYVLYNQCMYCVLAIKNGVARTLKKLRTSKGDCWIKLFKMGTSLKGKNSLPEGANFFFKERAVPYDMENHFYHIR